MKKSWHVVVGFAVGVLLGNICVSTMFGRETKADPPDYLHSPAPTIEDYGGQGKGYRLLLDSSTQIRIVPEELLASLDNDAVSRAIERVGAKRKLKHIVPLGSRFAAGVHTLIVITDDPRNPEKR